MPVGLERRKGEPHQFQATVVSAEHNIHVVVLSLCCHLEIKIVGRKLSAEEEQMPNLGGPSSSERLLEKASFAPSHCDFSLTFSLPWCLDYKMRNNNY